MLQQGVCLWSAQPTTIVSNLRPSINSDLTRLTLHVIFMWYFLLWSGVYKCYTFSYKFWITIILIIIAVIELFTERHCAPSSRTKFDEGYNNKMRRDMFSQGPRIHCSRTHTRAANGNRCGGGGSRRKRRRSGRVGETRRARTLRSRNILRTFVVVPSGRSIYLADGTRGNDNACEGPCGASVSHRNQCKLWMLCDKTSLSFRL